MGEHYEEATNKRKKLRWLKERLAQLGEQEDDGQYKSQERMRRELDAAKDSYSLQISLQEQKLRDSIMYHNAELDAHHIPFDSGQEEVGYKAPKSLLSDKQMKAFLLLKSEEEPAN